MLGLENGYAIGKDIRNIARFKELGVSYITLCHNGATTYATLPAEMQNGAD